MSAFSLARWFTSAIDISGDEHWSTETPGMTLREEVLNKIHHHERFAVHDAIVIFKCQGGVGLVETRGDLCWVEWVADNTWTHYRFWMNRSSLKDIGECMRKHPEKRVKFDTIFVHGV